MLLNPYFGQYGGQFVPELLLPALDQLERAYVDAKDDPAFRTELDRLLTTYAGRPTPLTRLTRLTEGTKTTIYLKREDLLHGGAHKTNQVLGQALLTKRMGKTRVIAETGAGQHGVATALASALFGFKCRIYMGAKDVERQKPNVFRMELMGAEVVPVTAGSGTLKEACNAALRNWAESFEDTHYMLGTAAGPHPFPTIVREFQKVIGEEARAQFAEAENGLLPDAVIACDVFETATTKYADILLPASHPLERSDIAGIGGYAARGIVRSSQVFEPKGNVLSDYEIFRRLAAKLGLEGVFTEGLDEQSWQRRLYEEAVRREAAAGLELPDWDAFVKKGIVFFPEAVPGPTALERFAADPEGAPLATESGRIMLASKRVAEAGLEDCPGHPAYLGEPSKPGEYRLVSPKSAWRLHSQLDAVTRRAHNTDGCEPCWINEDDAARLGISTGDAVRLSTPRGSVRAAAVVTDRVRPGVLALHHGAWAETTEAGEREDGGVRLDCRHGAANVLVPDLPTSGWSRGNNAAAYDVRLERL